MECRNRHLGCRRASHTFPKNGRYTARKREHRHRQGEDGGQFQTPHQSPRRECHRRPPGISCARRDHSHSRGTPGGRGRQSDRLRRSKRSYVFTRRAGSASRGKRSARLTDYCEGTVKSSRNSRWRVFPGRKLRSERFESSPMPARTYPTSTPPRAPAARALLPATAPAAAPPAVINRTYRSLRLGAAASKEFVIQVETCRPSGNCRSRNTRRTRPSSVCVAGWMVSTRPFKRLPRGTTTVLDARSGAVTMAMTLS